MPEERLIWPKRMTTHYGVHQASYGTQMMVTIWNVVDGEAIDVLRVIEIDVNYVLNMVTPGMLRQAGREMRAYFEQMADALEIEQRGVRVEVQGA